MADEDAAEDIVQSTLIKAMRSLASWRSRSKGTELVARADGTVSTKSVDPFAADWAWTTEAAPPFIMENATLEAFLQWAARDAMTNAFSMVGHTRSFD